VTATSKYPDQIDMMALLYKLAPLHRTLANRVTDLALQIVADALPGSVIEGFPCGSAAWSWTIPQRWELDSATIKAGGETRLSMLHGVHCT